MAGSTIRFGTDGWRGVIAEEFTFERVRWVAAALADEIEARCAVAADGGTGRGAEPAVVVGFDRRFLSAEFARAVAEVMAGAGIRVLLAAGDVPTPAVSVAVRDRGAVAGVVITASHNPSRWNGFKIKESFGGSALPETTARIERAVQRRADAAKRLPRMPFEEATRRGRVEVVDLRSPYLDVLRKSVDLPAIGKARLQVVVDPIHGAGAGVLLPLLLEAGLDAREIRGDPNPTFGGVNPEPIDENLAELRRAVKARPGDLPAIGLALDGDADRIGAVDEEGETFDAHRVFACVLRHLLRGRGLKGTVVQTISSTVMVRRLARAAGCERIETPIGFKHIAEKMLAGGVLIGGEESGGLGFRFHLPDRDGSLSALLLLEACAHADLPPRKLLEAIFEEVGEWHYARVDLHLDPAHAAETVEKVRRLAPATVAGRGVAERSDRDGVKLTLEGDSWLLLRPSGTEPVLRIYAEAESPEQVRVLLAAGREMVGVIGSDPVGSDPRRSR